jgi:hypothetical protein
LRELAGTGSWVEGLTDGLTEEFGITPKAGKGLTEEFGITRKEGEGLTEEFGITRKEGEGLETPSPARTRGATFMNA